jgi:uncharacterized protein
MAAAEPMIGPLPRALTHPEDPLARGDRPLNDGIWAIDHWRVKLLQLSRGMHLPSARAEASRRHRWMLRTLEQLQSELAMADSPWNFR